MSEPIPILFTIPNFTTAGSGRVMLNVAERLDRKRFAPAVGLLQPGGDLEQEVARLGFPLIVGPITIPPRPYLSLFWRAYQAARVFRPHRFALWHSWHYKDDYTEPLIARFAGARGWIYTKKNMSWGGRAWQLRTFLAKRVAAQNRDMVERFYARPAFACKTCLLPCSVDAKRFQPDTPPRLQLRAQFALPPDAVVVGSVGHLLPIKGHDTLVRAVAKTPGVFLWFAGKPLDKPFADSLEQLVEELGIRERVRFLGGVADVPAFLAEVDIFAFPTTSKGEGCPGALLEAMATARACVATRVTGSRDMIEDGVCGRLVPPADPDALAQALNELAASPKLRHTLGWAARQRVLDHYSQEREVAAYTALYMEALGGQA